MTKINSHNFSFCISEYLQNRYNFLLDERICYILGCSWGLQRLSRKNSFFISGQNDYDILHSSYLEALNPQALDFFVTNLRAICRIDHNNDVTDARWIASDYQTLGKIKTFVILSNSLFADDILIDNQPVFGVTYIEYGGDPIYDFGQVKDCSLKLDLLKGYSMDLPVFDFIKHWKIDNCEMFNANRYVIIPPHFKSLRETLPSIINNSLRMNYQRITNKTLLCGSTLLTELMHNLKKNTSEERMENYIEFLLYSLRKNSLLGNGDMDRKYLSTCFEFLSEQNYIKDESLVDITELCGANWNRLYQVLQGSERISFFELYDMLREITNTELEFEKKLKIIVEV